MLSKRTVVVNPLGSVDHSVGPPWIGLVSAHPADVRSDRSLMTIPHHGLDAILFVPVLMCFCHMAGNNAPRKRPLPSKCALPMLKYTCTHVKVTAT